MQVSQSPACATRRTTVYFDGEIHQALRLKAAASGRSMSELVNRAVGLLLLEDAEDMAAHRARSEEATLDFEQTLRAPVKRKSIMDYVGCMQGIYGETADEVDKYLRDERASWER